MNASAETSVLEVANVGLEAVALPHFDGEKVVVVLLDFSTGDVLDEKCLSYLLEVMGRMRWKIVKSILGHAFQADEKIRHKSGSLQEWTTILS